MAFWLAEPICDQFENNPKFIEPHLVPWSWVVAYTRCWPLNGAVVKSFNDTHPDRGAASTPDDDHRYDDGKAHEPPPPAVVVVVGLGPEVGGGVVGVGLPGFEHASAEAASRPAVTRPAPRREIGALIGR
jgi:hypothetical protein